MHKICDVMDSIENCMLEQMEKGIENIDTDEFGKVADIYKDLAQARYYISLVDNDLKADVIN